MKGRLILVTLLCMSSMTLISPSSNAAVTPSLTLSTDKVRYLPNQQVYITAQISPAPTNSPGLTITQWKLGTRLGGTKVTVGPTGIVKLSWKTPNLDFQGYLITAQLSTPSLNASVGVDVSSDWGKFVRYGFLGNFGNISTTNQSTVIKNLARYHINGLQFYDWQDSHSQPLAFSNVTNQPLTSWSDIAKRPTYLSTIKSYVNLAHSTGMKAMNYNLIMGSYAGATGVSPQWAVFKDSNHVTQDKHPLPSSWESDLYLLNPGNLQWQGFLVSQEKKVQTAIPFDGWHVDQLGSRGTIYDYYGRVVDLPTGYNSFLKYAKTQLSYDIAMNAVDQFGARQIINSQALKFAYSELWSGHETYQSLKQVIDENSNLSSNKLSTVIAAYMNYNKADQSGTFNEPGVLLTDAVIFASGGSHLELGEHMLGKEYFPNANLSMSSSLTNKLIAYYDFLTAYQNLLRDGAVEFAPTVSLSNSIPISIGDNFATNTVWTFAKSKGSVSAYQFLNFTGVSTNAWRDTNGTQPTPTAQSNVTVTIKDSVPVKSIWLASPDINGGSPTTRPFTQTGGTVTVTMPSLAYWNMLVLQH